MDTSANRRSGRDEADPQWFGHARADRRVLSVALMSCGECAACLSLARPARERGDRADDLAAPCEGIGFERTEAFERPVEDFTPGPGVELLKSLPVPARASCELAVGRWLPLVTQRFAPDPCRPQPGTGEQPADRVLAIETGVYAPGGKRWSASLGERFIPELVGLHRIVPGPGDCREAAAAGEHPGGLGDGLRWVAEVEQHEGEDHGIDGRVTDRQ